MSIDWLLDLERDIDNGKEIYGCQGVGRNQWVIGKPIEELRKIAKRTAEHSKMSVNIVHIISKHDTIAGDMYLVPVQIGDSGSKGEPSIQWKQIDTKDAADMMKDVRKGPAPFFGIQTAETIEPSGS